MLFLVAVLAGCSENDPDSLPTATSTGPSNGTVEAEVPSRDADPRYTYVHMSDEELWSQIAAGDSFAMVGLKAPGEPRGEYHGKILISATERSDAEAGIAAVLGVIITERLERLPIIRVRLENAHALAVLRTLPIVDYVEPAVLREGFQLSAGCSTDSWSGSLIYSPTGDLIPRQYAYMNIPEAWRRASGDNVTVGIIDTGIYSSSQQMVSAFTAGESGSRWARYEYVDPYTQGKIGDGGCSHGTRVSSVATAPRDGAGLIGVAWKANLASVRFDNDVVSFDVSPTIDAIGRATGLSNVVGMAWGTVNWFNSIAATIEDNYYNSNVLFIGAAGTNGPDRSDVVFPAEMQEVIAVTASGALGIDDDAHHGEEVLLTAAVRTPSAGRTSEVLSFQGSSNAVGLVTGAAAVVWQYMGGPGTVRRDNVKQRLIETADRYPNKHTELGYGQINVARAVGALWSLSVGPCADEVGDCTLNYKLDQCTWKTYGMSYRGGTGPFSLRWWNGDTDSSTSIQLCPEPYKQVNYSLWGSVTDDSDGNVLSRNLTIKVTHSNPDYACPTCPK